MTGPRGPGSGTPERIDDHRVSRLLGEGGQGAVYLGESPSGARVAIKVLHARLAADPGIRRRFLREAEVAASVAAFCTARVISTGVADGRPYIVSEYVQGPSLDELVRTGGPRTGSGLERLAVATLTALASIHRAGVVHRDFKPGNVILGPEGPVVIDFGIARALDHMTSGDQLAGTPAYMSPEQIGDEPLTGASDMFSWAGTMIFAATGRPAFPANSVPAILHAILSGEADVSGVPGPLRRLVSICLTKDPAARPAAADLLRDLTGDHRDGVAGHLAGGRDPGERFADGPRPGERPPGGPWPGGNPGGTPGWNAGENPGGNTVAYPDRHPGARPGVPAGMRHGGHTLVDPAALTNPVAFGGPAALDAPVAFGGTAAGPGLAPGGPGGLDGAPTSPSTGAARHRSSGRRSRGLVIVVAATVTALAVTAGVLLLPPLFGEQEAASAPKAGASLDLTAFPRVDVVDRFADDTSGQYAAYRENNNEILPVTTAGSGKFAGTGSAPFFGLVAGTGTPSSGQAVSVLTVGTFAGTGQPEDSVFVGWVKGGNDYVTAWYNNTRKDTGINVRVNGTHLETPGQSSLTLEPGDRFALLLSGDMITSYAETDGVWHRLITADIGDVLATPKARQEYRYGFGLRGSTGTIGIAGTEGRSAG